MCGIAGLVGSDKRERAQRMRAMRDLITHRGPDSAGELVDGVAALGVRRLRVIDLITGDQPLSNEDGTVWTVFNGEIYNFRELRATLVARGHTLHTAGDTEVIPHLYEDYGEAFVEHLDGMFALAVWDQRERCLVLARDRLGKKPLLYAAVDGELAFASEHRALLASERIGRDVDQGAIRLYLRLGYVPGPRDAFSGIHKVPPGHTLTWRDGTISLRRYWAPRHEEPVGISEAEAVSEIRRLVDAAVTRRLVADVPIGAFLSGGIDSGTVVAMMARHSGHVRTFTIDFTERGFSEAAEARKVAQQFGTEHHEFTVRPMQLAVLPQLVEHFGEPYADSSALPTHALSKLTREHVTVALNGDGGDEIFAGYDRYAAARIGASFDRWPALITHPLARLLEALPAGLPARNPIARARRFATHAPLGPADRYLQWSGIFPDRILDGLLDPEFAAATASADEALRSEMRATFSGRDPVAAAQATDLRHYLPDDLLVKVDIASMANSLEVRSPLLDTALVDFVLGLPAAMRMPGTSQKHLLKQAMRGILPDDVLTRRKQGFGVPIGEWLRGELRPLAEETLGSTVARGRGYFAHGAVDALLAQHQRREADHSHRIWALLMLEQWHRTFTDRPSV